MTERIKIEGKWWIELSPFMNYKSIKEKILILDPNQEPEQDFKEHCGDAYPEFNKKTMVKPAEPGQEDSECQCIVCKRMRTWNYKPAEDEWETWRCINTIGNNEYEHRKLYQRRLKAAPVVEPMPKLGAGDYFETSYGACCVKATNENGKVETVRNNILAVEDILKVYRAGKLIWQREAK